MVMSKLKKYIGAGVNVGLYDVVNVFCKCKNCGRYDTFDAQTKDLGQRMYTYHTLNKDFYNKKQIGMIGGKKFRDKMPVFKKFPKDKSAKVWKNQTEQMVAEATVPKEFKKRKFVNVIADCHSEKCQLYADLVSGYHSGFGRSFEGKIRIKDGKLIGEIYDIK